MLSVFVKVQNLRKTSRLHFALWLFCLPAFLPQPLAQAKTLHIKISEPPASFDWTGLGATSEALIMNNIGEGLYGFDHHSQKWIPKLASAVKKSTDLKEYTFTIRKEARWSDGHAVRAQDFVDAWRKVISPGSASIYSYYLFDVQNAAAISRGETGVENLGVVAKDDHTLTVKLSHAIETWEQYTSFWPFFPIRKDLLEKNGNAAWKAGALVSPGPFVLHSYTVGKSLELKRNPFYYEKTNSNVDSVDIRIINDSENAFQEYETGQLDVLSPLSSQQMVKLQRRPDFSRTNLQQLFYLGIKIDKFPMNSKKFRQALFAAIDRGQLLSQKKSGLLPVQSLIPPPLCGSEFKTSPEFDPRRARELLKESGVVINKNLKPSFLTPISEPFFSIGESIRSQLLQNLGIDSDMASKQNSEFVLALNLEDYGQFLNGWTQKLHTPQDFLLPFSSISRSERTHFKNPFFDLYINEGMSAPHCAQAGESFRKAEELISKEDAVVLPLFLNQGGALAHKNVKHVYYDSLGVLVLNEIKIQ